MQNILKYKWPPFASSFTKAILIFAGYMGISIFLANALPEIRHWFKFKDPFVEMEFIQCILILITLTVVLMVDKQKWLKAPQINFFPLKGLNVLSLFFILIANRIFVLGILWLDDFFYNIPFVTKPLNYNFSTGEIIIMAIYIIGLGPVIEEIIFRKWILGQFKNNGNQIYVGLIISAIMFSFIHYPAYVSTFFSHFTSGLILGLVYLRYGLKGSIISHAMNNMLWFFATINRSSYDKIITWLDFGFLYWFIVILSTVFVMIFTLRSIKFINSKSISDPNQIVCE